MSSAFLEKAASVALALGFSIAVALLIRRRFGGWASDQAMGRGACLSLLAIGVGLILSPVALSLIFVVIPEKYWIWGAAFGAAGLLEELARYVALMILLRGMITSDPREFIAGASAIGLGFGVIENLFYLQVTIDSLPVGALRGVLSAPAHLSFAFISAFGLWCVARRGKPVVYAVAFFLLAALLHGLFDVAIMAWPDLHKPIPRELPLWKLLGNGIAIFVSILATTVSTLLIMTEFVAWADAAPRHDPRTRHELGRRWRNFAASLGLIAAAFVVMPALVGVSLGFSVGVLYAPFLIGAAGSLALWSAAIARLAK